jgi:hypothetical protein
VGEDELIEGIRRQLLVENMTVSEAHRVNPDSKQLSTAWTSPEVIETLKFVTTLLQTSGASLNLLLAIRAVLKEHQAVVAERKDSGAQLEVHQDTPNEILREFAEKEGTDRK